MYSWPEKFNEQAMQKLNQLLVFKPQLTHRLQHRSSIVLDIAVEHFLHPLLIPLNLKYFLRYLPKNPIIKGMGLSHSCEQHPILGKTKSSLLLQNFTCQMLDNLGDLDVSVACSKYWEQRDQLYNLVTVFGGHIQFHKWSDDVEAVLLFCKVVLPVPYDGADGCAHLDLLVLFQILVLFHYFLNNLVDPFVLAYLQQV